MNHSAPPLSLKTLVGCFLLLTLFSVLPYFNALKGSFQFDDREVIGLVGVSSLDAFGENIPLTAYEIRPVVLWTLALNNSLRSGRVFGFHLLNLQLHILTTLLVFLVLWRSQIFLYQADPTGPQRLRFPENRNHPAPAMPFLTSLLFAVHPLNTESVAYISSRSSLLATFFSLLTLYCFLELISPGRGRLEKTALGFLAGLGMYLAIASKLIAVALPALLFLWYLALVPPGRHAGTESQPRIQPRKLVLALFGILLLIVMISPGPDWFYQPKDQGLLLYGRVPYLLVQAKVIVFYYLRLFFFPVNLNVDSGFAFTSVSSDPGILMAVLAILGILGGALWFGGRWVRLGILWFFLALAPTSSIIPLNDPAVEHRMYFPMSLGLCLLGGWGLTRLAVKRRVLILVPLMVSLSLLTVGRNTAWVSELNLWQDAAAKNPGSPRTHNNLGKAYYERGQLERARLHLEQSVRNIPTYAASRYNLSDPAEFRKRRQDKGGETAGSPPSSDRDVDEMNKPFGILADFSEPHYNLGNVYLDLGRLDEAGEQYQTALRLNPDYFQAHLGLGSVYNRKGNFDQAIIHFRQAIASRQTATGAPDYPIARINLGEVYGKTGRLRKAIREWRRVVQLDPSHPIAHFNLGTAHLRLGELSDAEREFTLCLQLDDRIPQAHYNLARLYQNRGDWDLSTRHFERFLQLEGPHAGALAGIAWNHQQGKQREEVR